MIAVTEDALVVTKPYTALLRHRSSCFASRNFGVVHHLRFTTFVLMRTLMKQAEDMPFPDIANKSGKGALILKSLDQIHELHDYFSQLHTADEAAVLSRDVCHLQASMRANVLLEELFIEVKILKHLLFARLPLFRVFDVAILLNDQLL